MDSVITAVKGVASELAISGVCLFLLYVRKWLASKVVTPIVSTVLSTFKKEVVSHSPEDDVATGRLISDAIAELKGRVNADRVMVIQFHNGESFLASNPIWKMSCTHETVREGVSYEARNIHAQHIGHTIEQVSALWDKTWAAWQKPGFATPPGLSRYDCGGRCDVCAEEAKVVVMKTSELTPSSMQAALQSRGTMLGVSAPLVVKDNIVGFIAVDYTMPRQDFSVTEASFFEVCETAKRVSYFIANSAE